MTFASLAGLVLAAVLAFPQGAWAQELAGRTHFRVLHVMSYHSPMGWADGQLGAFQEQLAPLQVEYRVLRMSDVPLVEVKVISTDNPPSGIGEAGVPVIAPAIANAVGQLTGGKRLRQLPMLPNRVQAALRAA